MATKVIKSRFFVKYYNSDNTSSISISFNTLNEVKMFLKSLPISTVNSINLSIGRYDYVWNDSSKALTEVGPTLLSIEDIWGE